MENSLKVSEEKSSTLTKINVIENSEGKQCVSARELHEKLEIITAFKDWFPRMCAYGFIEGADFCSFLSESTGGRPSKEYWITIEMAKQICMLQRTDKGREYREYFLNLEKAWNSPEAIMSRALQIANKTLEDAKNKIVIQQKQIEELTPDAESWRAFAESDGTFSVTNVAKCLGLKRDDIFEFLKLRGYIMREHTQNPNKKGKYQGTALGIERGYIKNYVFTNDKTSNIQFHLTPKGMQKVEKAFLIDKPAQAEKERIETICKEYEKNIKSSSIGLAE